MLAAAALSVSPHALTLSSCLALSPQALRMSPSIACMGPSLECARRQLVSSHVPCRARSDCTHLTHRASACSSHEQTNYHLIHASVGVPHDQHGVQALRYRPSAASRAVVGVHPSRESRATRAATSPLLASFIGCRAARPQRHDRVRSSACIICASPRTQPGTETQPVPEGDSERHRSRERERGRKQPYMHAHVRIRWYRYSAVGLKLSQIQLFQGLTPSIVHGKRA